MGLWIPLFLVLATTSCTTAQEWKVDKTGKINIPAFDCDAIKFKIKEETVARITVEVDDLNGCSTSDFRIEAGVIRISFGDDVEACSDLDSPFLSGSFGSPSGESIFSCISSLTFLHPIDSSCSEEATFTYTIETRSLERKEVDSCKVVDALVDSAEGIAIGFYVSFIGLPILIIVGIVLCCCFCSCCPCCYKRNQQAVVIASTVTAAPQQEMVRYPQPGKPV